MYDPILNENKVTKFVELCAWCDSDKIITKQFKDDGYRTSHGICKNHFNEVIQETMKFYEKNGFSIAPNDTGTKSDGVSSSGEYSI
jgi:hypothetical protein